MRESPHDDRISGRGELDRASPKKCAKNSGRYRIKLPRLLCKLAGGELNISVAAGKEFTFYPQPYKAVVHCGGCVITLGQMLARIRAAAASGCQITNYGMAISMAQGVLHRTLSPFPEALSAFEEELAAPHGVD